MTKWLAFAGRTGEMTRYPLILDVRVWRTLNLTLGVTHSQVENRVFPVRRYLAYLDLVHDWADELNSEGMTIDGEGLEFVLLEHNGKPLSRSDRP